MNARLLKRTPFQPFRLYESCPVDISYQNFGTAWLVILRGKEEDIESTFNGFYNFSGTNGELDFHTADHTIATFWSKEENLMWAFATIRLNHYLLKGRGEKSKGKGNTFWYRACKAAGIMIQRLRQRSESFINYSGTDVPVFSMGDSITAEKPDYDGKDLIILSAFEDKGAEKCIQTELDTEGKE